MYKSDFQKAAFEQAHRPLLFRELQIDPQLRQLARDEVERLALAHQRGQLFDRDAISRMTHDLLVRLLAQVDAEAAQEPEVKVA